MNEAFINLTPENLATEHLCCIIRAKTAHPGVEAKRAWLAQRLTEGHVFRKLNAKGTVFIEYAPLEKAWVPIQGDNYLYIYCLWVTGEFKGKGYAKALMEYCLEDARRQGKSGVCMLGADKQKGWLSNQSFAMKYGFEPVDRTENGYQLLALSLEGSVPRFTEKAKACAVPDKGLTVYYDFQCPFIRDYIEALQAYCQENGVPASFRLVDSLEAAKDLPCVFNNWALFWNGRFETVNLLDVARVKKIIEKDAGSAYNG